MFAFVVFCIISLFLQIDALIRPAGRYPRTPFAWCWCSLVMPGDWCLVHGAWCLVLDTWPAGRRPLTPFAWCWCCSLFSLPPKQRLCRRVPHTHREGSFADVLDRATYLQAVTNYPRLTKRDVIVKGQDRWVTLSWSFKIRRHMDRYSPKLIPIVLQNFNISHITLILLYQIHVWLFQT